MTAIGRMLDEAVAQNGYHEVTGPEAEDQDRGTLTTARFVVPAGGWELRVVAMRVPGADEAILWVQSAAD
jgi:hypothetical protein